MTAWNWCPNTMIKVRSRGIVLGWSIDRPAGLQRKQHTRGVHYCAPTNRRPAVTFLKKTKISKYGVVRSTETAQPTSPGKKFTKACARDVFCCMPHFFNVLRDDLGPATSRAERSVTRAIAGQQRNTYANFYTKYAKHNIWFMIFYAGRGMIIHMSGLKAGGNS